MESSELSQPVSAASATAVSLSFSDLIFIRVPLSCTYQFSSVAQSCPTLCNPMDCSTPGLPVHHQLPEFTQTHVHWVGDAIQPSHPLSSPSPPAFNLQGQLNKWLNQEQVYEWKTYFFSLSSHWFWLKSFTFHPFVQEIFTEHKPGAVVGQWSLRRPPL